MRLPLSLRCGFFLGVTSALLYSTSAVAAEKVVLKYGSLRGSLSVDELTTFAETGKTSSSLRFYLAAGRGDPQEVRQTLNQEVKVSPLLLDRSLNNPIGEVLIDQVNQVVHTPSGRADRQALRSALVLSAARDNRITLIETIQNYPTSEVEVEGDRLVQVLRQLSKFQGRVQDLLGELKLF